VACECGKARHLGLVDGALTFRGISHFSRPASRRRCGRRKAIVSMRAL
jgi:hypothetical protein